MLTKMLNKKKLKIGVKVYRELIANYGDLSELEEYCGRYYINGFCDALLGEDPLCRNHFKRQRDYERYINGYNNYRHIKRYI